MLNIHIGLNLVLLFLILTFAVSDYIMDTNTQQLNFTIKLHVNVIVSVVMSNFCHLGGMWDGYSRKFTVFL